jgi:hypothetical protein
MSAYAFVFNGSGTWKLSTADDWELDWLELDGDEKAIGHYKIDGAICKVIQTKDGQIIALTK